MSEPLIIAPTGKQGNQPFAEEQYQRWLDEMAPYLKMASTLYYACDKADILQHYNVIYRKYKLNDWFATKVDAYRRQIGEIANNATVRLMQKIDEKIKQDMPLTKEEQGFMQWFSEKHRTAQPFFVTRTEQVVKDDKEVGKILDVIETDYDTVGREAKKQVVAVNPPIQNKGQDGGVGDVQAKLPATVTLGGTVKTQI